MGLFIGGGGVLCGRKGEKRSQFELMAEQVQERYQALKRQLAGVVCITQLSSTGGR